MRLKLVTLAGIAINEEVYEVIIPTTEGEIAVFSGHEHLVAVAKPGVVTVKLDKSHSSDRHEFFAISGGIIEITGKTVKILVDEADHGDDIIEAETQAALDRAVAMRDSASNQVELEKAHQLIDRHMVRLRVADLHRHRHRS